ncbi:hypothetical protein M5K25_004968 [Dendrobium thyrsiflorum]|uniref:Uncharacterized protein n=1 Tax=Dendrobium thyrsiflorum TaxID=117978 RepID=A0ABD0VGB3_DENTH
MFEFREMNEVTYLGVKMALRRLVAADFQSLIEKAMVKMNAWSNKFISLKGRMILVKSVILSLPIFLAMHSLVPGNKQKGGNGIHYVSWDVLCKPKNRGGRGIIATVSIVRPIRAKFAWNIIVKPDSLLNHHLIAKYGSDI